MCCKEKPRFIFVIRNVRETSAVVPRTPQHYQWPLLGEVLMSLQLTDSQQCELSIKPVDKKGNPAKLDGKPVWSVDNTELLAAVPSDDGMSCTLKAVGPLGSGTVSVKADADLGEGVTEVVGVANVEIVAGQAVSVNIEAGAVTEQPEVTPADPANPPLSAKAKK